MTTFLLDTNVISETVRPRPSEAVLAWLTDQSPATLFLASPTLGELMRGACRLEAGPRRQSFERWIERDLAAQFEGRILPFDTPAALRWGELMGEGDRAGTTRPAADTQIAAIALSHGMTLATRNTKDFETSGVPLCNPWTHGGSGG